MTWQKCQRHPRGTAQGTLSVRLGRKGKRSGPSFALCDSPPPSADGALYKLRGLPGDCAHCPSWRLWLPPPKGGTVLGCHRCPVPKLWQSAELWKSRGPLRGQQTSRPLPVATQMGTRIPLGGGGRGHHHALLRLPPCGVLLRNRVPPAWRQAQAPDADAGACRKMHSPRQCRPRGSSRGGAAFVPGWGVGLGACPLTRSPRTAPPGGPAPPSCFSGRSHPARHPYFTRDKCHRARGPARRTGFWVRPRLCFDAVSTAGAQRG